MKWARHRNITTAGWLAGVLALGIVVSEVVIHELRQYRSEQAWLSISEEANQARVLLESRINAAASRASGVAIYVSAVEGNIAQDSLEDVLAKVHERGRYFRNIGLAPDNRIDYIYPREGNESVLGIQYEELPDQWPVIERIIAQREGRLAGPLPLVQGGTGLLYREPIFVGDTYWGLLSTVIDADAVLATLDPLINDASVHVALRGRDASGADGEVFLGSADLFTRAEALLDVFVPGGSWQMAIAPSTGALPLSDWQRVSSWLVTAAALGLLLLVLRVPFDKAAVRRLEHAVAERTQRLSRSNGLLAAVLDSAQDFAIIATDPDGTITLFNRGAEAMLGYRAEEAVGILNPAHFHSLRELQAHARHKKSASESPLALFRALVADTQYGRTDVGEWTYQRKDGSTLPVWLVFSQIKDSDGKFLGYLSIATDQTEHRQSEQMKTEFISTVSHELRTPITALAGAMSLLRHGYADQIPEEALKLLDLADRNSTRLQALIQDLLDIQQMETGKLTLSTDRLPLHGLLSEATELAHSLAEQNSIHLQLNKAPEPAVVAVDPHRFQQVMGNLLSNAIKFSPPGSTVTVRSEVRATDAVVKVCDQGPGIPDAFRPRLFRKFSQLDSGSTRNVGGTGLGLAISQELMQRMGGRIDYETAPEGGAIFSVSVPMAGKPDTTDRENG